AAPASATWRRCAVIIIAASKPRAGGWPSPNLASWYGTMRAAAPTPPPPPGTPPSRVGDVQKLWRPGEDQGEPALTVPARRRHPWTVPAAQLRLVRSCAPVGGSRRLPARGAHQGGRRGAVLRDQEGRRP